MAHLEPQYSPPTFENVDVSLVPPPVLLKDALKTEHTLYRIGNLLYHARLEAHLAGCAQRQLNRMIINSESVIVKTVEELVYADQIAPPHIPFYVDNGVNPIELGKMMNRASTMATRTVNFPDVPPPTPPRAQPQHQ